MIAFFTALKEEREAVRRSWGLARAGSIQGVELEAGDGCVHLCTGMGAERVTRAVVLARKTFSPSLYVLVGFSVGLQPELEVGDLVCDRRSDPGLLDRVGRLDRTLRVGHVATCGILRNHTQKAAFAEKHPESLVADLETEAFLRALPESRCLVVRAVSDDSTTDLPLDFGELVNKKGFPDVRAIGLKVAGRPTLLKPLLELGRSAGLATRALTRFLDATRSILQNNEEETRGSSI